MCVWENVWEYQCVRAVSGEHAHGERPSPALYRGPQGQPRRRRRRRRGESCSSRRRPATTVVDPPAPSNHHPSNHHPSNHHPSNHHPSNQSLPVAYSVAAAGRDRYCAQPECKQQTKHVHQTPADLIHTRRGLPATPAPCSPPSLSSAAASHLDPIPRQAQSFPSDTTPPEKARFPPPPCHRFWRAVEATGRPAVQALAKNVTDLTFLDMRNAIPAVSAVSEVIGSAGRYSEACTRAAWAVYSPASIQDHQPISSSPPPLKSRKKA
ncbi:hypothetical protein EX30DRAFT_365336 [Ascodesmis nigricans]|uniref:Uncharacterized protein n=1 Tax=Ascodesmis nigricans TaxID=341454 RepID=A0A4S2MQD1_9PEZI|nr:hypothetical protein EX30DRAFT_365336 [Ascodesmis nigricans]